jgi:cytidylate kinase
MKRVICISGDAASGKSTAARMVAEALGPPWRVRGSSEVFQERGIPRERIPYLSDREHRELDAAVRAELASAAHLVLEARLAGFLALDMEDALRVFCFCPADVRAVRARQSRFHALEDEEVFRKLMARDQADIEHFLRLYGVDYRSPHLYHLMVNTHLLDPGQVAAAILAGARETASDAPAPG